MDTLRLFVTVAESGSFTAAAAQLNLTVAAVSRRIKALEQRLGVRLFNRTTRRVRLTEAGEIYLAQVRRSLAELRETELQLTELSTEPRGALRINAPMSFGVRRLAPLVAQFAGRHPHLEIQLQLDDTFVDIVREGFDLALRIGHLADSSLVARPLVPVPRYICAAPTYLEKRGRPQRPADLHQHDCLHYNNISLREDWTLGGPDGPETVAVQGGYCSNNGDVLCQAAIEGLGIVLSPDFIVADALAEGRLVRILEGYEPPPYTLHAVYPSRAFVPAKVRLFSDFLIGALQR